MLGVWKNANTTTKEIVEKTMVFTLFSTTKCGG